MTLTEIWCSECGGFVGYSLGGGQPLPSIMHGPCAERGKHKEAEVDPFMTPLGDPRIRKMIDEAATVLERK